MRFVPTLPVGLGDQKLTKLFTEILRCLANVLESNTYTVEVAWSVPFILQAPMSGQVRRADSPSIVRLGRAVDVASPATPVHFGATTWEWRGDGSVKITDVDGLVAGTKYRLTFEVVG